MYSLRNNDDIGPFKSALKDENDSLAIYRSANYGPTFGWGHDLIFFYEQKNAEFHTHFGRTYKLPPGYTFGKANANSLLAGSYSFTPSEVEVLYLN